ncbi:unnamed protein product [Cladocopium goreaui]|uniref:Protein kinase domain-containing protein n=1 Tax=Cladocopium goreaui TaxID=2562237 RepID=A0A9P1BGX5_9DINO|nr:unnamed protein product [Cladocopium goreaui]
MSTVATYKDFKLVKGYLKVSAKEWVKTGKKKHVEKIRNAAVVLILRDATQKQEDITIRDNVTRCGSGASKDVFTLDNYNFVVKMMTDEKTKYEWRAEQQRFDRYKHVVEKEMMYCFGQIFLEKTSTGDGDASILLAEKLLFTGKSKLTSLFVTMQCTPQAWESYVQMQVEILRLLFRFVHHDVVPWDAKIDNVGLAEAREPHSAAVWVFCDLDGLRDTTEYPNVGGSFKQILETMVNQDRFLMQPHQNDAIAHGWQAPYEKVQTLMREALVTHEMGTERWTCPSPSPPYLKSLETQMLAVKPETGDKEANFPYPFTQNLLPRTSASEVHRAAASSHTVTAPMAPPPAASPDASMKSASEIAMGSEYHSTGSGFHRGLPQRG